MTQRLHEQTALRIARRDGSAAVSAFVHARPRVEEQAALPFAGFLGVAGVALVDEDGADAFLEEVDAGWVRGGARGSGGGEAGQEEPDSEAIE